MPLSFSLSAKSSNLGSQTDSKQQTVLSLPDSPEVHARQFLIFLLFIHPYHQQQFLQLRIREEDIFTINYQVKALNWDRLKNCGIGGKNEG